MTQLNQSAPPPPAAKEDILRFEPFPRSDSYVLTLVAFNYIPDHPFERKDEKTGEEYIKNAPAVEFIFGAIVDGKPAFVKTWPQQYSISDRANYYKYYSAMVGVPPTDKTNVADMVGKAALCEVVVESKTSKKGTAYKVSKIKTLTKVPSMMAAAITPLDVLQPALTQVLKALEVGKDGKAPF